MNKLQFWKKEPSFNLGSNDFDSEGFPNNSPGGDFESLNTSMQNDPMNMNAGLPQQQNQEPGFAPNNFQNQNNYNPQFQRNDDPYQAPTNVPPPTNSYSGGSDQLLSKEIEIISSKIDALRAAIDSLNQRVINIEHLAREEKENKYKW